MLQKKKKTPKNYLLSFYTSTTSSFSNSLSNSFNSFSKSISLSKNFIKLDENLHPLIRSLSKFY